jgi:hypothetical protein
MGRVKRAKTYSLKEFILQIRQRVGRHLEPVQIREKHVFIPFESFWIDTRTVLW